ncbi:MAG TPA: thioesterase family protein [Actinomycetes bacterium]|nr:thioesterase family protein [Actinomycetes bacterium]
MRDDKTVAVPFADFSCGVPPTAIDYNGHMNDAAYAQVLTEANELFLDALGLSVAYRERTGCAMYTVEITIKFLHEVNADDTITAESRVASFDSKRLRVHSTLKVGGTDVATGDSLYLHVDTNAGRVAPFPEDRSAVLASVHVHDDEAASD